MTLHREKCKLFGDDIFMAPSSAASKPTPLGTTYEFESRKQIDQDIMIGLRDNEEENMIGIFGMGGLGKTIMAKRIMNKALEDDIFKDVVIVVVSQTVVELKIQVKIGGSLGLKDLEKESEQARVQELYERLTSSTKRTLIVLEDVWKIIKLKELGIPIGGDSKGCRILITSRNDYVLKEMGVKKVFGLKELSEEEAWFLFKEIVGSCVEDVELNSIAKQVVSKCKGLPIAIEIVGALLKDERSKIVWKDALKQLRKPNPKNIPDFIANAYKPLIVSYDKLDNDEVKSLFLLCCLFPEDDDISLENLAVFCMGLRIFEDMRSVEEVRDRVYALVKRLRTRSLLLDSEKEDCVRMHDVVRDIGIFTRKQKEKNDGNNCTWFSSNELRVGEETSEIPSLNLCYLLSTDDKINIENAFFEGMRELYVLAVVFYPWTSLPQLLESLNTIRTLVLDSCMDLETISGVGGLVNLEILICHSCYEIEELPHEIGRLKHLKVLDFTWCYKLKNIAPGIISSLVELEELKMLESFEQWGTYNSTDKKRNAGLGELESLTKLTCLEIQIENLGLVAQQIKLSTTIKRFHIQFGHFKETQFALGCKKNLLLQLYGVTCPGHWVEKLMKETEYLCIKVNEERNLDLALVNPNIRFLKLDGCESIMDGIGNDLFQHMEGLELSCFPQLHDISWTSFQNLKTISLRDLPSLEVMWRTSGKDDDERSHSMFSHIECLELSSLSLLQEVWNGPVSPNSFQNLKKMHINNLPALKQLGMSNTSVSLPQLNSLEIKGCGMMEQLFQLSEEEEDENAETDQHSYMHLFCQPQKVSFGSLKNLEMDRNPFCRHIGGIHASLFNQLEELCISKCDGNSSLITSPIARNLTNLRKLCIVDYDEMVRVIEDENEDDKVGGVGQRPLRLFPKLLDIELRNLSKLVSVCKWKCDAQQLPSLKQLNIMGCPNMTTPLLPTLQLEYFETDLDNYLHAPFKEDNEILLPQIPLFSFHGLQDLVINEYQGVSCIFSSSVARNLVNLGSLFISGCSEIVKVIETEEEDIVASGITSLIFPNLKDLTLIALHKLEKFGEWKHDVELPLLKSLFIYECPQMTKFALGSISTPLLLSVDIDGKECRMDASTDLNGMLLQTRQKLSMEMDMWIETFNETWMWEEMEMEMEEWMETKFIFCI